MLGEDALAQQLAAARETLGKAVSSREEQQVDPVTVEGAEGRLQVTVGTDGRIEEFSFDPRVLKEGSAYLAAELKQAVNAALDERAAAFQTDEPLPDMDAINEAVADLQDRAIGQMRAMSAEMSSVMRKLQGRG